MSDLTPTEDLMMEVLAARYRLDERLWTFDSRHAPTARRLEAKGLVAVVHGIVEQTIRVSLTDAGKAECLSADYIAPVFRPECPAFYVGPRSAGFRVDCDRKRRHRGKHRKRWEHTALDDVTWLDDDECACGADPLNPANRCPSVYSVSGTVCEHRCDRREGHGPLPGQVHRTDLTGDGAGDTFEWTDSLAADAQHPATNGDTR